MPYSEFLDWTAFLLQEETRHTKQDHYLAQLTAEVVKARVKHPNQVKMKHYLLNCRTAQPIPKDAQKRMAASKAAWGHALKIPQLMKN